MPATGTGQEIAIFLVGVVFGIYIILLILRTIFGLVRADYYNPISQTIVMLTDPPLRVLRPVIPSVGRVDLAAIVLMIVLKFIEIWLRVLIVGVDAGVGIILAVAIRELLTTVIWVFIIALIAEVVMSWLQAGGGSTNNPIMRLAGAVNRPILGPLRRALPNTGAIDFSPMIALVGLYILLIIVRSF
ncbi:MULTISPECIES: YggT family protein [Thioalkalivibrio]|uniref:YggT family protein n=1 Tax=Thioalkalivibrio TaxID=106633 RepID=UPI000363E045|nr:MULTISPECIES: YggT family protein [Thioalkalivibrio]OOC48293.1 YggT family protein [Thioalkalivibrio versutus]